MPKIPNQYLPGLVQIRPLVQDVTLRIHENVTWFLGGVAANYSQAQLQAIGSAFNGNYQTVWQAHGQHQATFLGCVVTDWTGPTGLSLTVPASIVGTGVGDLAANTAILISLKQLTRYTGGHGRVYLPALSSDVTPDGVNLVLSVQTAVTNGWVGLITAMNAVAVASGGPLAQVIFRQRTQVVPHTTPPTYRPAFTVPVANAVCAPILATQRRRLRKAPHH